MKKQKAKSKPRGNGNDKGKSDVDPLDRDMSFIFDKPEQWVKLNDLLRHLPKDKTITLRLSSDLLSRFKKLALKNDTQYQKLIREALVEYLAKKAS